MITLREHNRIMKKKEDLIAEFEEEDDKRNNELEEKSEKIKQLQSKIEQLEEHIGPEALENFKQLNKELAKTQAENDALKRRNTQLEQALEESQEDQDTQQFVDLKMFKTVTGRLENMTGAVVNKVAENTGILHRHEKDIQAIKTATLIQVPEQLQSSSSSSCESPVQAAQKQYSFSPGPELPSVNGSPNYQQKDVKDSRILPLPATFSPFGRDSGNSSVDQQSVGTPSLAEELEEMGEQLDMDKQPEQNLEVPQSDPDQTLTDEKHDQHQEEEESINSSTAEVNVANPVEEQPASEDEEEDGDKSSSTNSDEEETSSNEEEEEDPQMEEQCEQQHPQLTSPSVISVICNQPFSFLRFFFWALFLEFIVLFVGFQVFMNVLAWYGHDPVPDPDDDSFYPSLYYIYPGYQNEEVRV